MKARALPASLLLTLALPLAHLAYCVAAERGAFENGWIVLSVADLPVSLVLFGMVFREGRPMLWFGVFGTLWWFLVSCAAWATWRLMTRRRRQAAP